MKPNENILDRFIRVLVGSIVLSVAFVLGGSKWSLPLYVLGMILVITGITGFCAFYELFGLSSCNKKCKNKHWDSEEDEG